MTCAVKTKQTKIAKNMARIHYYILMSARLALARALCF